MERIPQPMVTMKATDRSLAFPALTPALPSRAFQTAHYRLRERGAQIKIATDALRVRAIEEKQSLGIPQIEGPFEVAITGFSVRAEISQQSREVFELGKLFSESSRGPDPVLLFLEIFGPSVDSRLMHAQEDFV